MGDAKDVQGTVNMAEEKEALRKAAPLRTPRMLVRPTLYATAATALVALIIAAPDNLEDAKAMLQAYGGAQTADFIRNLSLGVGIVFVLFGLRSVRKMEMMEYVTAPLYRSFYCGLLFFVLMLFTSIEALPRAIEVTLVLISILGLVGYGVYTFITFRRLRYVRNRSAK